MIYNSISAYFMDNFDTYCTVVSKELENVEAEVLRYRVELNLSLLEIVRLKNNLENVFVYGPGSAGSAHIGPSADFKAVCDCNIKNLNNFKHDVYVRLADHGINLDLLRSDVSNAHNHYHGNFKATMWLSKTRKLTERIDELCKSISSILS